ncbi:outer membrane protein, nutrient binding [Filimonas lacunae]|nr:outer membrane protein, nutrient binding [Filimonas lacunae]
MHDMEKAALQDPFLADALEGYSHAPLQLAAKHLNQIAASLQQSKEEAIITPIARTSWQWWKVAALVIVIAGAGAISYQILQPSYTPDSQASRELAQNQPQQPAASTAPAPLVTPKIVPVVGDTIKPSRETVKRTQKLPTLSNSTAVEVQSMAPKKQLLPSEQKKEEAAAPLLSLTPAAIPPQTVTSTWADTIGIGAYKDKLNEVVVTGYAANNQRVAAALQNRTAGVSVEKSVAAAAPASYKLSGTITDQHGKALAGATVKAVNGHAFSITDDKGRFAVKAMDSTGKVEIASVGYETTVASVSASKSNVISLEEEGESLSDMVVTELHTRSKAKETAKKSGTDSLYPDGGWQSFQEYVYKKIHQEMDTTGSSQKITGEIELEFAIDANGNPYDMKVLKSFNNSMNDKAISALENGPKWIGNKKKKGRVIVRF